MKKFFIAAACLLLLLGISWQIQSHWFPAVEIEVSYKSSNKAKVSKGTLTCASSNCSEARAIQKATQIYCPLEVGGEMAYVRAEGVKNETTGEKIVEVIFSRASKCQKKRWDLIEPLLRKSGALE